MFFLFFFLTMLLRGKQRSWTLKKKEIKKNYFSFPAASHAPFADVFPAATWPMA